MNKNRILFFIFLIQCTTLHAVAQSRPTEDQYKQCVEKHLTYYWIGRSCPHHEGIESSYGFKIRCVGCTVTPRIERKNRRTMRIIDSIYGRGWFKKFRAEFNCHTIDC